MIELFDKVVYAIFVAIAVQVITNIVVVAVLKKEVELMRRRVDDIDKKATRAHTRVDDINVYLRSNPQ